MDFTFRMTTIYLSVFLPASAQSRPFIRNCYFVRLIFSPPSPRCCHSPTPLPLPTLRTSGRIHFRVCTARCVLCNAITIHEQEEVVEKLNITTASNRQLVVFALMESSWFRLLFGTNRSSIQVLDKPRIKKKKRFSVRFAVLFFVHFYSSAFTPFDSVSFIQTFCLAHCWCLFCHCPAVVIAYTHRTSTRQLFIYPFFILMPARRSTVVSALSCNLVLYRLHRSQAIVIAVTAIENERFQPNDGGEILNCMHFYLRMSGGHLRNECAPKGMPIMREWLQSRNAMTRTVASIAIAATVSTCARYRINAFI